MWEIELDLCENVNDAVVSAAGVFHRNKEIGDMFLTILHADDLGPLFLLKPFFGNEGGKEWGCRRS